MAGKHVRSPPAHRTRSLMAQRARPGLGPLVPISDKRAAARGMAVQSLIPRRAQLLPLLTVHRELDLRSRVSNDGERELAFAALQWPEGSTICGHGETLHRRLIDALPAVLVAASEPLGWVSGDDKGAAGALHVGG